ncbi:MAG: M20 aminoacylase family protein [Caldilineaceae bacterium]
MIDFTNGQSTNRTRTAQLLTVLERDLATYIALRHQLHALPETSYEEHRTSALVATELESYGLEVTRGVGRTGVVGVLRNGSSRRAIGLRADMDALPIAEQNDCSYRSTVPGKMHACGHDGHTTMLLWAARHLSSTRDFDGTVIFIFQPAEEAGAGGREMVQDGLFERFPVDEVYGMHNIPSIPVGHFAVMPGPMMASGDFFKIELRAKGGHAALPHTTADPILAGSALVQSLQSIVSRTFDPLEPAVLSVTQFHGGEVINAIPATVTLQGTARSYTPSAQDTLDAGIHRISAGIAASYGLEVKSRFRRGYPPTINSADEAEFARQVLERLVGSERVLTHLKPLMTAEDFSYMLQVRPGAYIWIGNGDSAGLHTGHYDFNDAALPFGAAYWVCLAESALQKPVPSAAPDKSGKSTNLDYIAIQDSIGQSQDLSNFYKKRKVYL